MALSRPKRGFESRWGRHRFFETHQPSPGTNRGSAQLVVTRGTLPRRIEREPLRVEKLPQELAARADVPEQSQRRLAVRVNLRF